ncbi:plasma-membrane choline transporter family protein [Nitzschia inconspicua]|uniref:Choline transporter-like protein n=1 Tax=Nitzschia inconspicua TaxID=303405 RepID=A0A9K3L1Z3_9STRA|nr:plasma-membrane choline transporter family protein [Nitzschia inconspicua]
MQPSIENEISERLLGPETVEDHTLPSITISDQDTFGPGNAAVDDFTADPRQTVGGGPLRAEAQQPEYRDAPFAIAFVLHILVVLFLAFGWGVSALRHDDEEVNNGVVTDEDSVSLSGLLWLCFFTSLASIAISAVSLKVMTHHAETLIQSILIASCCMMGFLVVAFLMDGLTIMGVLWLLMLLMTGLYAYYVWGRIPAAAANLRTALSAIQTNGGVCILAYGIAFLANIWVVVWCLAFVGVSFKESSCVNGVCQSHLNALSVILLILSYHWTSQVIKNVLHVTVSGVVGTWWFAPQDCSSVWSPAIMDSFSRATTYSFGSICMGSLLVAVIQTLETIARNARRSRDGNGLLLCILECILHLLSRVAKYFNKWAYVYVGLYGYDYLTAGKKVLELFEARGWTTIINDNLIHRCLVLVAVVIGAITGFVGMLLAKATGWATAAVGENSDGTIIFICFIVGVSMAIILMGVVLSAVDTIIVSFAEAPSEFETNHPALYQNMVEKWRIAYPDEF